MEAAGAYIHSAKTVTSIDSHTTCSTGLEVSRWVLVPDSVKDAMLVFKMSYVCDLECVLRKHGSYEAAGLQSNCIF